MKTTLNTLKNTYAQEQGYEDWSKMRKSTASLAQFDEDWTNICIRAQKAALEKAANPTDEYGNKLDIIHEGNDFHVPQSSITNPENLIR